MISVVIMDKNRIIKIWNTLKSWLIYGGKFIVYIAKFVVWESKKIIVKYPKYVAIAGGVVVLVVATALSVPPILKWLNRPRPLPLTTAPASSGYQFAAADKKTQFSVLIGESGNNTPKIQATFGNVSVDFVLTDLNQNISKPSKTTNKVVFKDVRPNVDLSYQTLTNGIKEEIIVKAPSEGNAFTFTLNNFGAAPRKIAPQTYGTVFYDTKGTYAFHFSKPFAVDATGARTDNVLLSIHKADTDPSYKATVIVNKKWLADPARAYPISIDPTIVYDTTAEFAAGQMNRVTDTQPATGDGTGGTITYSGGYTIHTFTSSGTFTPPSAMNVETLVVAGGGGGGQDYGGGGGGGGVIYNPSFAVTAQAYPITVGNGMATETQGQNSVFSSLTAVGGGAGGRWGNGGNGGSGGGAGYLVASGGTATSGQGSNGGSTVSQVNYRGSGGGGGSQVGYASNHATYPGQGGAGYTSSISGTSQVYAGGGGAAGSAGSGAGGSGGGGNAPGGSGTANTGGGGASCAGVGCTAGSGGSGIVIIRYPTTNSPNLTTNYQELATDINTIGFYHFGNGACATDSSGNAYTLTANGGMTCATGGMFGYKASGFTTGPVSYSHTTILDRALPSGTIEAWINPANLSAVQTILYADSTSDTLLTLGTSGQINFSTSASTNLATANAVVPISTWTHVAATWTSAGHKIYINGVETASDTNTTTHTSQDYTTYVGVGSGGNTLPFSGSIDELRMSNIARTPEEIKLDASRRPYSVYTSDVIDLTTVSGWNSLTWTELGVTTGDGETLKDNTSLVAQWNFNETSGTAADNAETTADRDLTLNNFASTASQDQAAGTGWTANNKKWGAGALMLSSVATADTLSAANPGSNGLDPNSADMTIEMWVKTNDVTAELLSNNSANGTACTSNGYYLGIDASGYPVFYLDTNGATAGCDAQISTPTTKIHDGKWHFLAVSVTRGTSAIMYLDGVNIGSDTSVTSYSAITVAGNVLVGSTNAFDGVIDSTRVYSRALSQNEIMSNYQAGNVELQTRVGSSTDANDGTWEAWKPTTGEAALASMDSDAANWTWDSSATYMPQAKSNESTIKVEGSGSLKQILGQPQVDDLPGQDGPLAAGRRRILDDEPAAGDVHAERADDRRAAVRRLEPDRPAVRQLAVDPVGDVEPPRLAMGDRAGLEPGRERLEEQGAVDRPAAGGLAQAGHGRRQLGREVGRRPVGVQADPDDRAGVVRAEADRLTKNARQLAHVAGLRLDHEVVGPLQADRAVLQPGDFLGRVGHRQGDDRGQKPGVRSIEDAGAPTRHRALRPRPRRPRSPGRSRTRAAPRTESPGGSGGSPLETVLQAPRRPGSSLAPGRPRHRTDRATRVGSGGRPPRSS